MSEWAREKKGFRREVMAGVGLKDVQEGDGAREKC